MKPLDKRSKMHVLTLVLVVIGSRIPFLFDGYGHEEDSYGLVVNAWEMHSTGHYVASRFPGHPFQEYVYALIWNQPAWIWNSFSILFSVVAVVAFYHAMKKTGIGFPMETALMFAFTPMFFIAGTYSIDYVWSLAFVLLSFWGLVSRKYWLCGIFLGMAVGCRITSGIFIIPWMMLLWQRLDFNQWRNYVLSIAIPFVVISVLWYVPAYMQYGTGFFDYSDQFPYPPVTKVIYKATIGVFGLLGIAALVFAKFRWLVSKSKNAVNPPAIFSPQRLTWVIVVIIVLHIISYLRLPQKAGYMLAIVPFVVILVTMYSNLHTIRIATMVFLLAPFLLGMNITDDLRGSGATGASVKFNISGQEISIDAARGPALAEQQKRRNKMEYVEQVCNYLDTTYEKQVVICGWWYNEIITERRWRRLTDKSPFKEPNCFFPQYVVLKFYATCDELDKELKKMDELFIAVNEEERKEIEESGYVFEKFKVYYLPEQDLYNDQMYNQSCTNEIAEPFPVK